MERLPAGIYPGEAAHLVKKELQRVKQNQILLLQAEMMGWATKTAAG